MAAKDKNEMNLTDTLQGGPHVNKIIHIEPEDYNINPLIEYFKERGGPDVLHEMLDSVLTDYAVVKMIDPFKRVPSEADAETLSQLFYFRDVLKKCHKTAN